MLTDAVRRLRGATTTREKPRGVERALAVLHAGDAEAAHEMLVPLLGQAPQDPEVHTALGWTCRELGDLAAASRHARDALALKPNLYSAHLLLAMLELPGVYYLHLLRHFHETLRPKTYVEIGVFKGKSLHQVGPDTDTVGIDPAPQIVYELGPRIRVHAMTSDAYFSSRDLKAEMGGRTVDMALIDGMHQFEYVLRDFANLERHCAPGSMILIHDGHPLDEATSSRERRTDFWTGDIWRAVLALRKFRPDLDVRTLASPPSGLTVVRRLDPGSSVLRDRMQEIVTEMLATDFAVLRGAKGDLLGLVDADWDAIRALFAAPAG